MKSTKRKAPKSNSWIFLLLICLATCFMGVGFARIDILLEITGNLAAQPQENLFITEVNYLRNADADLENSRIISMYQTILNSNIVLSQTNGNSAITYEVTIYNSTDSDYAFVETAYMLGANTYSNENIAFRLEGLSAGDVLGSKQSVTFRLTFYYLNNVVPASNQLSSILNFEFEPYDPLISAGTLNTNSITGIFGGPVSKNSVEKMYFVNHENVPAGASNVWDASVEGNYAITGWSIDEDQNGSLEVYFGANNGRITFPANCNALFYYYGALESIVFDNVDTSQVTNMSQMFAYSFNLSGELDLSNFDTSSVTTMSNMFTSVYKVTSFDLSNFDLSSATTVNNMFSGTSPQLIKFNNATFTHLQSIYGIVPNITNDLTVVVKDNEQKDWVLSKTTSIGANTEVLTVEEYENKYPNGKEIL